MSFIDWMVLAGTLVFIVAYGAWKTRGAKDLEGYLKGGNTANWWGIGISIMATQASAITFLSTPGQAYADGMGFVQYYFGLPIAMVILSVTFVPIYYRLKVYTAYEFLEQRFDLKTRSVAALLFLVQRSLAAGITIYAPAIILSTLLGWNLTATNILIGLLVIAYTVSGGSKAVTQTQKQQMAVMMGGMLVAGILVIRMLPEDLGLHDALHVAGKMGRLNVVNFEFKLNDRYNFWSGMTAAVFLFMAYFGTDQSQVQRYLGGRSLTESRLGLIMNGLLKVPMQFLILFIGVMVFVFYQFDRPPVFFNQVVEQQVLASPRGEQYRDIQNRYYELHDAKRAELYGLVAASRAGEANDLMRTRAATLRLQAEQEALRNEAKALIHTELPLAETNDKDYVFMRFVMDHLPIGMIGLLFAVMFCAAMSSTASELNALASTTTIDLYQRMIRKHATDRHYVRASKAFTLVWGLFAIGFATYASLFENLIQAVNLLGSLFYGPILGIFVVAFYLRFVQGHAVFLAALLAEVAVILLHFANTNGTAPGWLTMGFLWYNAVGCGLVVVFACLLQPCFPRMQRPKLESAG